MVCGLEVEFHIYRIKDMHDGPDLDPEQAAWPGLPPAVSMIHPGYNLLAESWIDMAEEPLRIVQHTAQALGLPLQSLEIELGPSQVEAVFDATDALTAADNMVLFRNGVRQALRRAGYHASFMCRPPFPNIMSSGWHLHQSLVDARHGRNAFMRDAPAPGSTPADALHTLSDTGAALAGRPAGARPRHGRRCARPRSTASGASGPTRWRRRRCCGAATTAARCCAWWAVRATAPRASKTASASPSANPYLYMAAQIHAGLDGLARGLTPPRATESPYASDAEMIPTNLPDALDALQADAALVAGFGDRLRALLQPRETIRSPAPRDWPKTPPISSGANISAASDRPSDLTP